MLWLELRDRMDYEVVDEAMIRDGGLDTLGIRVAVLAEGTFLEAETLTALRAWVEAGGVLVLAGIQELSDVEGDTAAGEALLADGTAPLGDGLVVRLPGFSDADRAPQEERIVDLVYRLSELDPARTNAILVDGVTDGIESTLFADRVLLYNPSDELVTKTVQFREADFPPGAPRPGAMEVNVELPAHSIRAIMLVE